MIYLLTMQNNLPKLNFPPIKLSLRRSRGAIQLYDQLRRCYIVLTPEEWVRQHVVSFLRDYKNIQPAQIIVEYPVDLNGQRQRADIVVVNTMGEAVLLCECKSHDVKISQSTLDQAVRYNSVLNAKYLLLSNGLTIYLYKQGEHKGEYQSLTSIEELIF